LRSTSWHIRVGPDAVAPQRRLQKIKGPGGGCQHFEDRVTRLADQHASGALGQQHPMDRGELGCHDPLLRSSTLVSAAIASPSARSRKSAISRLRLVSTRLF
jgi:hypothetical protein